MLLLFCWDLLEPPVLVGLGVMKLESGVAADEEPDKEEALEHWDDNGELGAVLDGEAEDLSSVWSQLLDSPPLWLLLLLLLLAEEESSGSADFGWLLLLLLLSSSASSSLEGFMITELSLVIMMIVVILNNVVGLV